MALYERQTPNFDSYYDPPENDFDQWAEQVTDKIPEDHYQHMEDWLEESFGSDWLNDLHVIGIEPVQASQILMILFKQQQKQTWNWEEKIQQGITTCHQDLLSIDKQLTMAENVEETSNLMNERLAREITREVLLGLIKASQDGKE